MIITQNRQMNPVVRSLGFVHEVAGLYSNPASKKENPAWQITVAKMNSIDPNHLNEKPGGSSQYGRVVPIRAGRMEAVQ
jgi:hypothetical protein